MGSVMYYDPAAPAWSSNSIYQFLHVFTADSGTGTHIFNVVGSDSSGSEGSGSTESFQAYVN